jgi:hypothetical protein
MGDGLVGGESQFFSDVGNGFQYKLNDLVDVFVGTAANIRGKKTIPVRGRFKGVRVVGGKEMILVRPFVGSQHGPCPAYPPESCLKLKGIGSEMYGESSPQFFSKMKPSAQERLVPPPPPAPVLNPTTPT